MGPGKGGLVHQEVVGLTTPAHHHRLEFSVATKLVVVPDIDSVMLDVVGGAVLDTLELFGIVVLFI